MREVKAGGDSMRHVPVNQAEYSEVFNGDSESYWRLGWQERLPGRRHVSTVGRRRQAWQTPAEGIL